MKKFSSLVKVMMAVLAIALAFGLTSTNASAAKNKKITMYTGEKINVWTIGGTLQSVKSNKKSVCSGKKKNGQALFTAKKAGKAKLTLKTNRGNLIYTVTVKKNPFKITCQAIGGNYVMIKVKNNSNGYFSRVDASVVFCDAAGNPITQQTGSVYYLGAKQTAYTKVYASDSGIDLSKTQLAAGSWSRSIDYKYKKYSKKVKSSIVQDSGYYKLRASTNYSGRGSIYVAYDIAYTDASGNIVMVDTQFTSLHSSRKVDTCYGYRMPSGATNYKVLSKRIYLQYS